MQTASTRVAQLGNSIKSLGDELQVLKKRVGELSQRSRALDAGGQGSQLGGLVGSDTDTSDDELIAIGQSEIQRVSEVFHMLNGKGSPTQILTDSLSNVFKAISNSSSSSDNESDDGGQSYFDMSTHDEYMRRLGASTQGHDVTIFLSVDHGEKTKWGVSIPQLYCTIKMIFPHANIIPVYHGSKYSDLFEQREAATPDMYSKAMVAHLINAHRPNIIVIPGNGYHINPEQYGEQIDAEATNYTDASEQRFSFEKAMVKFAAARGIPVLGVCGGLQVMAVESGCKLNQRIDHVPSMVDVCWPRYPHVESVLSIPVGGSSTSMMIDAVLQACKLVLKRGHKELGETAYPDFVTKISTIRSMLASMYAVNGNVSAQLRSELKSLFECVHQHSPWSGFGYTGGDGKRDILNVLTYCHHTQSIDPASVREASLTVTATGVAGRCKDESIEAVESAGVAHGIQFHPEMMVKEDLIADDRCDAPSSIPKYGLFAVEYLKIAVGMAQTHRHRAALNDEFMKTSTR